MWLNAETELTYPTVFGKGERKLMLKGEACFEVVTDTARPFIVESFYNRVEVLGTRFNVSAYTLSLIHIYHLLWYVLFEYYRKWEE